MFIYLLSWVICEIGRCCNCGIDSCPIEFSLKFVLPENSLAAVGAVEATVTDARLFIYFCLLVRAGVLCRAAEANARPIKSTSAVSRIVPQNMTCGGNIL